MSITPSPTDNQIISPPPPQAPQKDAPKGKGPPPTPRGQKSALLDMVYIEQVNKRNNKDFALFTNYQINPYTKKTLDFVTPKCNTRPPRDVRPECVPGYQTIKDAVRKAYATPMERFAEPQTEQHRYGWFEKGRGTSDRENYDDRFKFTHRTADFIKTQAAIYDYDKLIKGIQPRTLPEKAKQVPVPVRPSQANVPRTSQPNGPRKSQAAV